MLNFDRVSKRFGHTEALREFSLDVRPGEILGLLGPNGAGKSTSIHIATGLLAPDSGTVSIAGATPQSPQVRARLGIAPQAQSLYELLSGRENVSFFGRLYGLTGTRLKERVAAALDFVALTDRADDRVQGYSGGMQRRLNIACALVHDPDLILLDEPTAGVDPQSRNAIFDNVLALKARGKTLIYTTHYMEEAERLCDRVAIVDHGRLLALDTPAALTRTHGGPPTLVIRKQGEETRIPSDDPLATLNRLAADGGFDDFRLERPTLEQVFLHLTGRSLRD